MQKIHGLLTALSVVAIVSSIFTIIPGIYQTDVVLNGQGSALNSLSIAPAHWLNCDYIENIKAYDTNGVGTTIGSQYVYFNPQITYSLVNPQTKTTIDHFVVSPAITCNVDSGFTPYVQGTVEIQTLVTGNDGITRVVTDEVLPVPTNYFPDNQVYYLTTSSSVTTAQQVLTTLQDSPTTSQPTIKFYVKWNLQFGDKDPSIPVTTASTYLTNTWTGAIMTQQTQQSSSFTNSMYTQTTVSCPYPYVKSVNGDSCVPPGMQSAPFSSGGCPAGTYNAYTLTTGNVPYEICLPTQPSSSATSYTSTTLNHQVITQLPSCPSGQWLVNLTCEPISTSTSTATTYGTGQIEFFYTMQFAGDPSSYCGTGQRAAAGGCLVTPTNGILNIQLKPASIIGSSTALQSPLSTLNVEAVMNPSQSGLNLDSSSVTYSGNIQIEGHTITIPTSAIQTDGSNGFVDSSGLFRFPTASITPSTLDTIIQQAGISALTPTSIKITIYATGTFTGHNQNGRFTGVVGTTTAAPYLTFNAYYISTSALNNIPKTNNTQQTPTCVSLFGQQACFPTPSPSTQTPPPQPPNPCAGLPAGSLCVDNSTNPTYQFGNGITTPTPNNNSTGFSLFGGGGNGGITIPTPEPPSSGGSGTGLTCQGNDTSSCNTLLPPIGSGDNTMLYIGIGILAAVIIIGVIAVAIHRRDG